MLKSVSLAAAIVAAITSITPIRSRVQGQSLGLVAAYGMNEGTGTSISDATNQGHTGTLSGPLWSAAGRFGGALSFDGVDDMVTIADAADLDLTTGMTLEAWINPASTVGTRDVIIKEGPSADFYNLYARNWQGRPEANVFISGGNNTAEGSVLAGNTWVHLAATYDGSVLRLFVNGVQAASTAVTGSISTSNGALRIGGNNLWGEFFQGLIDEVRIYNRALSPAEIQADMVSPVGGAETAPVLSGGSPSGTLPKGTTSTTLSLTSNKNATCRYAESPGVAYESMPFTFATTGGLLHSVLVSGLVDGGNYSYYVRCSDSANNVNGSDYVITFSVSVQNGDTTPPSVTITSPPDSASVFGIVSVTVTAADNVGVTGVQLRVDNVNTGPEVQVPPFTMTWDTATSSPGPHTLKVIARDAAGNTATSPQVNVVVANNVVPAGFVDEIVIGSGVTFPTSFEFLPDGRMLVAEFRGRIFVLQPGAGFVDPTPVLDLPNIFLEDVTAGGERGLVNVVADPSFSTNGYIYVFYTAAVPQRDRVSRFTMTGNTANPSSEFVVWQGAADSTSTDHHGGGLAFGPDGKLYISTGDNGDPPSSQPLNSDHGKLLRVNKDGTIPSDNPFVDGGGSNIDAIWARGLRNPYRFSWDPPTGKMYIGEVGQHTTEEVNIGVPGANYGWPTCEGSCGVAGMTNPIYTYPHVNGDAAVTGGFVYRATQFPAAFQGVYFYGDFAQNTIRYLTFNGAGAVTGSFPFLPADGALDGPFDPVMLKPGPDGSLYYVDFGWSWGTNSANPAAIRRIRFVAGNQPPVASASASPLTGAPPLAVTFSSVGSYDPEGTPLTYSWTFGDGNTSAEANPVHTYAQSGLYTSTLSLSDGNSTTLSTPIVIAVGSPPQQTITSPPNGLIFRAGEVLNFSAQATDPEDGELPPSAYTWTVLFHHDSHVHPALGPVTGISSGTFTIPSSGHDFSGNTFYEFILTTTDSTGLQTTSSVSVVPHKVNLTFTTTPAGLSVWVDGIPTVTPFVKDTLTGFQHTVSAFAQSVASTIYGFVSWSDGGAQTHSIVVGETDAAYNAMYQATSLTVFPSSTTVLSGTLASGTAAALASDDNVYYQVASTTSGTNRTAAWYGSFPSVANELTNLRINYKGKNSNSCTQTIAIWNWSAGAWVQLDSRTVSTTEVAINNLTPTGTLADYVSGTSGLGELRVRIQCTSTANRTSRGDLMFITYDQPILVDNVPPTRSNGAPIGTLPSGTTQTTLSMTTDENAVCRFGSVPGVPFASQPNTFITTGGATHSNPITGLVNGGVYSFNVRCQDTAGNANTDDFVIGFAVAVPDGAPPAVALTAPLNNATVSGTVTLTADASDNVGVVGVQFLLNGNPLGIEDTTAPYSVAWTTTSVANGGYALSARARDAAGNTTTSVAVNVTVNNTAVPGLVASYDFDAGSGTMLADISGRGHTGTISGATWTTSGHSGGALTFNGSSNLVTVAHASDLSFTSGMTLEAWVFPTTSTGVRDVLIKEGTGVDIYNLYARNWAGRPESNVFVSGGNRTAEGTTLAANAWVHLAATYDGATVRLYVNGVQAASTAFSGSIATSTGAVRIGGNALWGEYFQGRIDDVRMYNRALSASEILFDMNTPVAP